ncbi:hypothetical protein L2E82_29486 [Cichorium intybus]|uniref:Uncharacterized protein n=1 Tax=Cichorium intybus TaxID=13427 RepID=A0ACB9CXP8_CICIN|nr:hypothetical protein L2E82_29486 [Cichorium intybus]
MQSPTNLEVMLKRGINVLAELDVPVHVVSCNKDDVKQVELHSESLIQSTAPRSAGFGGTRYATNIISSSNLAASIITTIGEEHLAALAELKRLEQETRFLEFKLTK